MGKLAISMAMFNSYVSHYLRVPAFLAAFASLENSGASGPSSTNKIVKLPGDDWVTGVMSNEPRGIYSI